MDWIAFISIILSLLLLGFFSGIEVALISGDKFSIELRKKQGTPLGKMWGNFSDKPFRFIGMLVMGFNVILVIYCLLWSRFMEGVWQNKIGNFSWNITNPYLHLLIETGIAVVCLLFFEFIFRAFFKVKSEAILNSRFISFIASFFYAIFSWMASIFTGLAKWILRIIFNVRISEKKEVFTSIDLNHFIQHAKSDNEEKIEEMNKELFENALSLGEVKMRECLVPRKEIEGVESQTSIAEVKNKFIATQLSKLIVFDINIDNIIGYVHQLDLFKNPATLKEILLPIPTIPESMSATDLMNKFSKERKSIAWVIDEFGGTAGIVTMEDLLEEIFGDIKDEYDTEEFIEKQLASSEFIFSGRLKLDYIQEKYNLDFVGEDSAETLSGYIIENHEGIPKLKDKIIVGDYEFDILNVSDTRIETVKLKILK